MTADSNGALGFRHFEGHGAGLHREVPLVMARPIRLALLGAFIAGGPGDLVGLGVRHRVQQLLDLLADQPVEFRL